MTIGSCHQSTPFLSSCGSGHAECALALIAYKCDVAATSATGTTALMLAAGAGHKHTVEVVLNAGSVHLEARDQLGFTAFLWACSGSNVACALPGARAACIVALVAAGCDMGATILDDGCDTGETGLMVMLRRRSHGGYRDVDKREVLVRAILASGYCDLEARDL